MLPLHSSPITLSHHKKLRRYSQVAAEVSTVASCLNPTLHSASIKPWNIAHSHHPTILPSCLQALSMLLPAGGLAANMSAAEAPGLVADSGTAVLEEVRDIVGQGLQDLTASSMAAVG
jgi:hypothetical protein